jgi:hypothetical protein
MTILKSDFLSTDSPGASGLARRAAGKFAGSWLACFVVMARSDGMMPALSADHFLRASMCGTVGAVVTVALLMQMDRTTNSLARQMTISAVVTFIGDIFAHPSHFPPQWAEPLVTGAVSAGFAIVVWYATRWGMRLLSTWGGGSTPR